MHDAHKDAPLILTSLLVLTLDGRALDRAGRVLDMLWYITAYSVIGSTACYFVAGLIMCGVMRSYAGLLWIPWTSAVFGASVGFFSGLPVGACLL